MGNDLDSRMLELVKRSVKVTGIDDGKLAGPVAAPIDGLDDKGYGSNNFVRIYHFAGEAWAIYDETPETLNILRSLGYTNQGLNVPFSNQNQRVLIDMMNKKKSTETLRSNLLDIYGDKADAVYQTMEKLVSNWIHIDDIKPDGHKALKVVGMTVDGEKVVMKVQDEALTRAETDALKALNILDYGFAPILFNEPEYVQGIGVHATYDIKYKIISGGRTPPKGINLDKGDAISLRFYATALLHSLSDEISKLIMLPEYTFGAQVFEEVLSNLHQFKSALPIEETAAIIKREYSRLIKEGENNYFGISRLGRLAIVNINGDPRGENFLNGINVDWNSAVRGPYTIDLAKILQEVPDEKKDYYIRQYIHFRNLLDDDFRDMGCTIQDVKRDLVIFPYVLMRAAGTRTKKDGHADSYSAHLMAQAAFYSFA